MNKEIILTPEQLYYMGRILQAKYIDYAYIAAMNDINQNFSLFETEAKASLVSSGILMEDFGGNLEVEPFALNLLKPVFFGETETSVDICSIGETSTVAAYKFHIHDGVVTEVVHEKGKLIIKSADQTVIHNLVDSLISETYSAECQPVETIDNSQISRVISFKCVNIGSDSVVKTYIEAGGVFYQEKEETIESVNRAQFVSDAFDIVKGV